MTKRSIACIAAVTALVLATSASSQDLGALQGGMSLGSLASGSAGNAAGILQFCISNNYLTDSTATSMKDRLIGKIGGADAAQQDSGYTSGAQGNLIGSDGKSLDITKMGSLESNLTQQACKAVLDHASSLL
ncbi:MAG TPA: DUF2501 domain-containing protein [Rhodanobacteraceae bacterium]|jgi:hypothetical protein|nr:DUF2501 domain-containing protein [Rhodanobacteraceae bacterium]